MPVKFQPDAYHTVTPYLIAKDAAKLIDFMKAAFGGVVTERIDAPDGSVGHAEVKIGDSVVMMGQGSDKWPAMPAMLYLYVKDCDAVYKQAVTAGATEVMQPADQFYGDRNGTVKDHSGNLWCIATHKEDLTKEELLKRVAQHKK